jgi:methylmalonyl-CoA/ethylmalonyl-CoA epimerase
VEINQIQKVGQIGIPVKNIERAIEFYQDKLGLTLLFHTNSLAFFECNGLRLMLSLPEQEEFANASSVIYFQVNNLNGYYKDLLQKEVTFLDEPHVVGKMGNVEIWMAFFKDTEGNTHAIMSEVEV